MQVFKTETAAFKAGGDYTAQNTNTGFRVIKCDGGFKVLMVPDSRWNPGSMPFYI